MHYKSALSQSRLFKLISKVIPILILLPAVAAIIFAFNLHNSFPDNQISDILPMVVLILIMSAIMFITFRILIRNQLVTELEVSDSGIRHVAPGKERFIKWEEITEVKKTPKKRSITALRLITTGKSYDIFPYLVIDSPTAAKILFRLSGPVWLHEDNSTEPFKLENSNAYMISQRYIPELLHKAGL